MNCSQIRHSQCCRLLQVEACGSSEVLIRVCLVPCASVRSPTGPQGPDCVEHNIESRGLAVMQLSRICAVAPCVRNAAILSSPRYHSVRQRTSAAEPASSWKVLRNCC